MHSLISFPRNMAVGVLVLVIPFFVCSTTLAQINTQKLSNGQSTLEKSMPDPVEDIVHPAGHFGSTNRLSKAAIFTDGTVRGYYTSGSTVTNKSVSVYADGRRVKYATITLPSQSNPTASVRLTLYSYYPNGLLRETVTPSFGRSTYTYNDSGKVSTTVSTYFISTGEVPYSRSTYTYKNGTVLTQVLVESYTNSTWNNSTRTTYYSDSSGILDSTLAETWQNGWVLASKSYYFYDTPNRTTTTVMYYPDVLTGNLEPRTRTISVGDTLGRMTQFEFDVYTGGVNPWTPGYRIMHTYDSEGFLQLYTVSFWSTYSNTWTQSAKYEYTKYPSPSVTLIEPNEGENYLPNSPLRVGWLASGLGSVDLSFSTDNGLSWSSIAENVPDTGYFVCNWTAPSAEYPQCKIKVSATGNPSVQHILEGSFSTFNVLTRVDHTTNSVRLSVLNNGYLGSDPNGKGSGFTYKSSPNALFTAGVFIGTTTMQGKGMLGSFSIADFQNSRPMGPLASSAQFDEIAFTSISEVYNTYYSEIGIRSQSRKSDDFVFVSYTLRNQGYTSWTDMYLGVFADWDVGNLFSNFGGIDSTRGLAYQNESGTSLTDSNYYGIVAFNRFSGATVMTGGVSPSNLISTVQSIRRPEVVGDNRMFIGSGPYIVNPGDSALVDFAFVAGANLTELQVHADSARKLWQSAVLVAASFEASTSSLNFGSVPVGATKKDSVIVTNHGTLTLNISAVTSTNHRFTVTPASASVPVNAEQKFYVTFAPSAPGQQAGKIAFSHNGLTHDTITVVGNGTVGGVETQDGVIPTVYELRSNYPNPFNPSTTILYGLPRHSRVVLKVYSLLGQEIATLVDDVQDAGYHRVIWSGQNKSGCQVASGMYLFRITARSTENGRESFTQVKKMLLLR